VRRLRLPAVLDVHFVLDNYGTHITLGYFGTPLGTGRPTTKPATFTFLGFKHFLTKTRRGTINIGRTASIKARERFLRRQADWLTANRISTFVCSRPTSALRSTAITSTSASDWPNKPCTPCTDGYASSRGNSCDVEASEPDERAHGTSSTPNHGSNSLDHGSRSCGSDLRAQATDVLWGAGCVNCACPVLPGGWGGDFPSLPDPRPHLGGRSGQPGVERARALCP
jgi:hypothetical protein